MKGGGVFLRPALESIGPGETDVPRAKNGCFKERTPRGPALQNRNPVRSAGRDFTTAFRWRRGAARAKAGSTQTCPSTSTTRPIKTAGDLDPPQEDDIAGSPEGFPTVVPKLNVIPKDTARSKTALGGETGSREDSPQTGPHFL